MAMMLIMRMILLIGTITNIFHRQPTVDTASSTGDRACRQLHGNAHGPADLGEPRTVLSSQVSQNILHIEDKIVVVITITTTMILLIVDTIVLFRFLNEDETGLKDTPHFFPFSVGKRVLWQE